MTLKEAIEGGTGLGRRLLIHRKYYDDKWNGERDGYVEVSITDKRVTENVTLIKVLFYTNFGNHVANTYEWHDLIWAASFDITSELIQAS